MAYEIDTWLESRERHDISLHSTASRRAQEPTKLPIR
jgi:hypothetical protein